MVFTQKLTAIAMILLINNLSIAANIDFKTIYDNASETCIDNQTGKDCKTIKELNTECDSTRAKNEAAGNETSTNNSCTKVNSDNNYVEPKFSTKRPRGQ